MRIIFFLDVKNYNNGPCVSVISDHQEFYSARLSKKGKQSIELDIPMTLPNKLILRHHGKDMKRDTLIDNDGKIIDDKGFTIVAIGLDDLTLRDEIYFFRFVKENGDIIKNSNYVGFNGQFVIDINDKNLYNWHSGWQKMLVTGQQDYSYEEFKKEILGRDTNAEKNIVLGTC